MQELNQRLSLLKNQIDSLNQIRTLISEDPDKQAEMTKIANQANSLVNAHKEFLFSFINKKPSSLACIAALYQQLNRQRIITPEQDMKYFKLVDSSLMADNPTSPHVKNFHSNILKMGNQKQEETQSQGDIKIGSIAPDISLPSPNGEVYTLSSLRGKYVFLDFWAAWCSPCRRENPTVVTNYNKYNSMGFEVFQVSLDKTKKAWQDAIVADNLAWKYHVSDLKYWSSEPAKLYNVRSIPSSFLIDPKGVIIAKDLRGPALSAKLKEIFKK